MPDTTIRHADLPGVWNTIAIDLARKGKFASAIAAFTIALRIDPLVPSLHSNLGNVLRRYGKPLEADRHIAEALRLCPGHPGALSNAACLLLDDGQPDKAVVLFDEVLKAEPANFDWQFGRACALLAAGRWKEGFSAYDCRLADRHYEDGKVPLWDGSPLDGRTLMIHAEQGLGDTIMFSRFLLALYDFADRIQVVLPQQLHALFAQWGVEENDNLSFHRAGEKLRPDVHLPLMSLPHSLRVETVAGNRYLTPPHRMALDAPPGSRHKIGLVWKAKANWKQQKPDELVHGLQKSMPLELLLELHQIPGAALFGLQVSSDDIETLEAGHLVRDLQHHIHDFADLASFVGQMDVVVSVDTAPAHLAGAMGVPTVVCLHHAGAWQWQTGAKTSWYDSTVSVRQLEPGVWPIDLIIEAVRERLG